MPNQPVAADFNQSVTTGASCPPLPPYTQGVHLSFSSTVLKVWRVELGFPILQGFLQMFGEVLPESKNQLGGFHVI